MSAHEFAQVAQADYGCDQERHHAALLAMLNDPTLAFPEGDAWFPADVVELVSHVPGSPGHVPCLAIVLLAALRTDESQGNAGFRLEQQVNAIADLPTEAREPFFAAFRHLYETVPHWSPDVPGPFTLPWVENIGPPPAKSDRRKR